jgi:hypothetical protein
MADYIDRLGKGAIRSSLGRRVVVGIVVAHQARPHCSSPLLTMQPW